LSPSALTTHTLPDGSVIDESFAVSVVTWPSLMIVAGTTTFTLLPSDRLMIAVRLVRFTSDVRVTEPVKVSVIVSPALYCALSNLIASVFVSAMFTPV